MDIHYIYTLINPRNNQVFYVGMSKNPKRRLNGHITASKLDKYKRHKYIKSLLTIGIRPVIKIIDCIDGDGWKELERFYIDYYKAIGYELVNVAPGGGSYPNWSGKKHTEETKHKISEGNKGKPKQKGKRGKQKNPQTTSRWDKGLIGRNGKSVYQYSLDGKYLKKYNSTNDAGIKNNISQSTVVRCCNKEIYRAKNFIFSYEYNPEGIEPFNYIHNVKVNCFTQDNNFVKQYNSLAEASKDKNTSSPNITAVLKNRQKTAGGYIWKYADIE